MPAHQNDPGSPGSFESPGSARDTRRVLERLGDAECMELLRAGRIARLVYDSRYGPVALPFEYQLHQGSIVLRTYRTLLTEEDLRTGIPHADYDVAVEIDQTDPVAREGWIVTVWGAAHNVDTEAERATIADVGLESWIEGEPEHFIRVTPLRIAGQRLRPA
jgi:uncharacterized protein